MLKTQFDSSEKSGEKHDIYVCVRVYITLSLLRMACRGCLECLLKLVNFLMTVAGLAMVGYGIYLFVKYKDAADTVMLLSPVGSDQDFIQLGRPMLMAVFIFIYWSRCGSLHYILFWLYWHCNKEFMLLDLCILITHLMFSKVAIMMSRGYHEIPTDKTGDFDMIYEFLEENWTIVKWVALGIVVLEVRIGCDNHLNLQAFIFLLALMVRAANIPADYDSDDEFIAPREQRQPLISWPPSVPASGVPVSVSLDQRPSRNDAWSARMREKYGLDTSEFTYNPAESNRYQQVVPPPAEERSRCTIM
ncbi:hypothetical protein Goshw_000882 [Gossypium schwendimanii]|uniref:Tobamovirus multiplication protein 2A n=1 Tax=Gossypium schwendimanii TaxID=34291 RepID=A0A7J9LT93_GOSSC|nr:hypothetical protein [Gossypium schwendimanii]